MADSPTALAVSGPLLELPRCLNQQEGFAEAVAALASGRDATLDGVWGSLRALVAAALAAHGPAALLVVCPTQQQLDEFCDDFSLFHSHPVEPFPPWEAETGHERLADEISGQRLRVLKRLARPEPSEPAERPPLVVATCIQALLQPVPSAEAIRQHTRWLRRGQTLDMDRLVRWLVEQGYHSTSAVQLPGEVARRGGIVDIFAPDWDQPIRIELFGEEIESIRRFDVVTQRSLETVETIQLTGLGPTEKAGDHLPRYLPAASWTMLVEPVEIRREAEQYLARLARPEQHHSVAAVMRQLSRFAVASASQLTESPTDPVCRLAAESVERFSGDVQAICRELDRVGPEEQIHIVGRTEGDVQRLQEILRDTQPASRQQIHFGTGSLHHGFRLLQPPVLVLSDTEMFQRTEVQRRARRSVGRPVDSFLQLRPGDLVVHLAHGIGRYRGMKLLTKDDRVEEHLELEFYGGTKIYVPASRIDLVQKYVGGTKRRPSLARIGGTTWLRQKEAARVAVTDLAAEMLQMQALRQSRPGIAFSRDTPWQREFDASFPYVETPDQLEAWEAIKQDMHQHRPMDRLLCGDVGFGKTELAMRAAFKAVESGYQVAVLAPTTILVEQHYHTFRQRMAEFPLDIARLSRFCSPAEQRDIVARLARGQIDIVIGTHRLASPDVRFYNLGLLIIDEEQRFGVRVKERLKMLRTTVDVLTLSATPIPRTLHMSLVGVRDICNLQTPPADRLAVQTRVTRFDPHLIRHAVLRELNRGGQIYFVHNRVRDIQLVHQQLEQIVPEARICVGHGQMPEGQLEQVMVDFVAHKFDLLLATTIVENGLDIPNANTIFIDEADRYGLADLHQLRGRVGRYKHRAYCYLLVDPHKHLTPNAGRRLRAIEEFSDMGAGFAIAMRDLEIRGAGNLLGTQQSGHIAAVGYELYCQLLENAVRQLRQLPPKVVIDVEVDLPGRAYLPDQYVPDIRQKVDLYRRLARVDSFDQLHQLRDEMKDRFGPLPAPARRMVELAELRLHAAIWQIQAIRMDQRYLVFQYADADRIAQLVKSCRGKLRVVDDKSAYVTLAQGVDHPDLILRAAKSVLSPP